jgi:hypothetical protein
LLPPASDVDVSDDVESFYSLLWGFSSGLMQTFDEEAFHR